MDTILLLFTAVTVVASVQDVPPSGLRTNCQDFVVEHETLECSCIPPDAQRPPDFSLKWSSQGPSELLKKVNVSRGDNGTVFTCTMRWNGHFRTVNYTLQVAYGPEQVLVSGPSSFSTNGSQFLNLTCKASGVHPEPTYQWGGDIPCVRSEANFCTLRPKLRDYGKTVTCIAFNTYHAREPTIVSGNYSLSFHHPPASPPILTRNCSEGRIIIVCKAMGGRPAVSAVNLSCSSETGASRADLSPYQVTAKATHDEIYSFVNVSCPSVTDIFNLSCTCRARWDTDENLYQHSAKRSWIINCADKVHCQDHPHRPNGNNNSLKQSTFYIFSLFAAVMLSLAAE